MFNGFWSTMHPDKLGLNGSYFEVFIVPDNKVESKMILQFKDDPHCIYIDSVYESADKSFYSLICKILTCNPGDYLDPKLFDKTTLNLYISDNFEEV